MDDSEAMFLIEILVEKLQCTLDTNIFTIKSKFSDIFKLKLANPNNRLTGKNIKSKRKPKLRRGQTLVDSKSQVKLQSGQSILFASKVSALIKKMSEYPLEVSLWSKKSQNICYGSVRIPWNKCYMEYLNGSYQSQGSLPVTVTGEYKICKEDTNKRIAMLKLSVKLNYFRNNLPPQTPLAIYQDDSPGSKRDEAFKIVKIEDKAFESIFKSTTCNAYPKKQKTPKLQNKLESNYLLNLIKSETKIKREIEPTLAKVKSLPSMQSKASWNFFDYIFYNIDRPATEQLYYVGYVTVEKDENGSSSSDDGADSAPRACNLPKHLSNHSLNTDVHRSCDTKCKLYIEDMKRQRIPPPDERILLDLTEQEPCCARPGVDKIEEVVGEMRAKMILGENACECTCECKFGFVKKTRYCAVCGGYEVVGDELGKSPHEVYPCPIYHKLVDPKKMKYGSEGSEGRLKKDESSVKSIKRGSRAGSSERKSPGPDKIDPERDLSKSKKKKRDSRFKFNYGYQGIPPHIGHSKCGLPCCGTIENVPKNMGWLWTAENVPGLKFRPGWRPGAANKQVVRMLRIAKNPGEVIKKKKKKETGKRKKNEKRPLLIVHKKNGEYEVTMETMKLYPRQRALNQYPYEDQTVLTYTIGRTEEENKMRQRKKERMQRRLERCQREFIQSAFKNMCEEICRKTYQQALGILPDAEDPDCLNKCFPAMPDPIKYGLDRSCSCSEDDNLSDLESETDSDEWIVEFTPPDARFDPEYKPKKIIKSENGTQYNYLDYRVKIVDKYGNQIPRYFKGPDGKQQCSDLGGFWSPDKKWLEINVDGFIGPDGKWAPIYFFGPNGEHVEAENGKFQAANGCWLVVGVDGYVDVNGKWKFYPGKGSIMSRKPPPKTTKRGSGPGDKKDAQDKQLKQEQGTWSCFGEASPKALSVLGITGHGHDKHVLISAVQDLIAHGENLKIPEPLKVPPAPISEKSRLRQMAAGKESKSYFLERHKCHHPTPSDKGIIYDERGHRKYFKLEESKNVRPEERVGTLRDQGIDLSAFHRPCFRSFINSEQMKQELIQRRLGNTTTTIPVAEEKKKGWRPGAITKRLLKKLNKAKLLKSEDAQHMKTKKSRKRAKDKPALIITKKDGVYRVEMQVYGEKVENKEQECYSPMIYNIASANNEKRLKKKERVERRLISKAVREVWSDHYNPTACEEKCLKAYKEAVGVLPYDPNNTECNCPEPKKVEEDLNSCNCDEEDDDVSSNCTSSEIEWEIYFTPPNLCKN